MEEPASSPGRPPTRKPPPLNTFPFHATCPRCSATYRGNYPRWIRVPPFRCLCGATVPTPADQPGYFEDWYHL